jgi:hypothetical protein
VVRCQRSLAVGAYIHQALNRKEKKIVKQVIKLLFKLSMKYSVSILLMLPGKGESKYDYNKDEAQLCLRTTMMAKVRTNIIYNNISQI